MKRFAVIGDPLAHSLSPVLHQEVYSQLELDASFERTRVKPDNLHSFMSSNKLDGFNVTIPHKQSVIPFLDELDESAQIIGAVNCVHKGKGYNTDWIGFLKAMEINKIDLNGKDCTILGAGGAAKAIAYALTTSNVKSISIINRSQENANQLSQWIQNNSNIRVTTTTPEHLSAVADLFINCTPLGMWPDTEQIPMNMDLVNNNHILVDTIYNPIETQWLKSGNAKGAKTIGGLDMFIAQGLASADIWFGKKISNQINVDIIRQILIEGKRFKRFPSIHFP
jgi:shikimate dehydrogenase